MKKLSIIALVLILSLSMAACGRRNNDETSAPTTSAPTNGVTIMPTVDPTIMDPTLEPNIPDPSVDTSMPDFTGDTNGTDATNDTGGTMGRSRRVH